MRFRGKFNITLVLCITLAICAFVGLVYATFTKTISLSGSSTINENSWKIEFNSLSQATLSNSEYVKVERPPVLSGTGTEIKDFVVSFWSTGSVSYTFYVENKGNYDAQLSSITIPTPTCTKTLMGSVTDQNTVCYGMRYTLMYYDSTTGTETPLSVGDTLSAGQKRLLRLKLEVGNNSASSVTADVEISNLGIQLVYNQA